MTTAPTPVRHRHLPRRPYLLLLLLVILVVLAGTTVVLLARENSGTGSISTTGLRGSGIAAAQSRTVPLFTAVDLAGSNDVTVHIGERQAVVVAADDNLIDLVTTDVQSGTLVVGTHGSFTTKYPMTVDVTVPTLDAVVLTGSGLLTVEGVGAEQLTVQVPGSGLVRITGTADRLDVSLAGSGDVQLQDLVARNVTARLSGSGRLQVHATGSLDAAVPGTGVILYGGNPSQVNRTVTGTGVITER